MKTASDSFQSLQKINPPVPTNITGVFLRSIRMAVLMAILMGAACGPVPPTPKVLAQLAVGGIGSGMITSNPGDVKCGTVCSTSVEKDTQQTLTAMASAESLFAGWGGACSGTDPTCTLTFDSDKTVIAYFESRWRVVVAGGYHSCILYHDGDAVCWGRNSEGQIGNGANTAASTYHQVRDLGDAVQLAAGGYHTCALILGGKVQCWGDNRTGQLGTGNTSSSNTAVEVSGIDNAISISAGAYHACARRADFLVVCWGLNGDGQLGDGTTTTSSTPQLARIPAVSVSAGGFHTCFILTNATVGCRGRNSDGQLGFDPQVSGVHLVRKSDGTPLMAMAVAAAMGVGQIGSAVLGGYHTCAIGTTDRDLYCWGNNNERQTDSEVARYIATNDRSNNNNLPHDSYLAVAAGAYHVCALHLDGIYCQGHASDGELGDGTFASRWTGPLPNTAGAYHLAAGGFHTCASLPNARVVCWGNNDNGQITGTPTGYNFGSPTRVTAP